MGGYGVFLIAALIVASGIIAYVGDVIGRRMGRRRLTLFGLRPRRTAIAISVLAGMLIAAFTLTSAMLVSQNVRDALLRVAEMRREIGRLESAARELETRAESSRRRAARAQRDLDAAKERLTAVLSALTQQTKRLGEQRQQLAAARERLRVVSAELATQRENLEITAARLREVSAELERERRELADQRRELEATRGALATTQQELGTKTQELSQVAAELANANRELDAAYAELRDNAQMIIKLTGEREQLEADIRSLSQQARQAFQVIRTQPVIFGADEEIVTAVVPGGRPISEVRSDLDDFVGLVNRAAVSGGAGARDNGRGIDMSQLVWDEATQQPILYTEGQVLDALAEAISDTEGSVIVRAASAGNVVRGETVVVHFRLFRNELVFHAGEELARTTIDSSRDQATLMFQLVTFLRVKVSSRGREAGVMPRAAARLGQGREALFPGPEEVVGEIPYPDLLDVIRQVQSRKGSVEVIAHAASDIWSAGPLRVKLTVEGRS